MLALTRRRTDDPVGVARGLVAAGCRVAVEPAPGDAEEADLAALIERLSAAGLAADCEVTLPVDRLGREAVRRLAAVTPSVALSGPAIPVDRLAGDLPEARVVIPAADPAAETRCRALASRRVRLVAGRRRSDLAFVRCLNVLMAGDGHPAVAVSGPQLIAIAGERAAWNGRTPDSWEYVVPFRALTEERQRLVAGGYAVRVDLAARRHGGRS